MYVYVCMYVYIYVYIYTAVPLLCNRVGNHLKFGYWLLS